MASSTSTTGFTYYCSLFLTWIITALLVRSAIKIVVNYCIGTRRGGALPGPLSLPFIGHLHLLKSNLPQSLEKLSSKYGPVMQIDMAGDPVVVVSDANIAKEILRTHDADFASRFILGFGLSKYYIYDGDGFIHSQNGPYWLFMKKLCKTKLFAGKQLLHFNQIREQETLKLLRSLMETSRQGKACDLRKELVNLASNIICKMNLGERCEENPNLPMIIWKTMRSMMECGAKLSFTQIFGPLKHFDLSGNGKKLVSACWEFDRLMESLLKDYEDNWINNSGHRQGNDVMDILLHTYNDPNAEMKLTKNQIKCFFFEIFMAGTDTTAAGIQWAIAELINNPKILKKLRDEIDRVVGSKRVVQESDIDNLPYLQSIVKETLRKHPPGPMLRRECMVDTKINGYETKAGTKIIINAYAIMQDPKTFNEPEKFIPERFLVDHQEMDFYGQDFHFLPFGSGRRACVGAPHALIVKNTIVATLVQCFDWKLKDGDKYIVKESNGYSGVMPPPLVCYPITRFDPFNP